MSDRIEVSHGFGAAYDKDSRILILGSFPSVKSREEGFYYANPRNRLWTVLAAIAGVKEPVTIDEKLNFLQLNRIALYDVIESCTIEGSSDSSIADAVPADLGPVLAGSSVGTRIYCNGAKAYELYRRYQEPRTGIEAVRLPSTSPANAGTGTNELIRIWSELIGRI